MTAPDPREDAPDASWVTTTRLDDDGFIEDDRLADGRASARMLGLALLALVTLVLVGWAAAAGLILWAAASDTGFWVVMTVLAGLALTVEATWFIRDLVHAHRAAHR